MGFGRNNVVRFHILLIVWEFGCGRGFTRRKGGYSTTLALIEECREPFLYVVPIYRYFVIRPNYIRNKNQLLRDPRYSPYSGGIY